MIKNGFGRALALIRALAHIDKGARPNIYGQPPESAYMPSRSLLTPVWIPVPSGVFPLSPPSNDCERHLWLVRIVLTTHPNSSFGGKGIISLTRSDYLNNAKRLSERVVVDLAWQIIAHFRLKVWLSATSHQSSTTLNHHYLKELRETCGSVAAKIQKSIYRSALIIR